ncbi:MAG: hypothetical protein DRQ57_13380 [Gammaproteobacteria bacterium]|nr:MAG: hypothetical protein DRQ57_13380 [Gammaproteobacteria bacterium]
MANYLKVGIVKQESTQIPHSNTSVPTLRIDDNVEWNCSELIDNQMYSTLFEYDIFGKKRYAVTVDGQFAQSSAIVVADQNVSSKKQFLLQQYLKILKTADLKIPFSDKVKSVSHNISSLVKAIDCLDYSEEISEQECKVLTIDF